MWLQMIWKRSCDNGAENLTCAADMLDRWHLSFLLCYLYLPVFLFYSAELICQDRWDCVRWVHSHYTETKFWMETLIFLIAESWVYQRSGFSFCFIENWLAFVKSCLICFQVIQWKRLQIRTKWLSLISLTATCQGIKIKIWRKHLMDIILLTERTKDCKAARNHIDWENSSDSTNIRLHYCLWAPI